MFFFKRKYNLLKSGILAGKTDIHSHILPGVDDGSPDQQTSLELLSFMEGLGYREVWLTPHVMADLGNTAEKVQNRFNEFKPLYKGPIQLHFASEYMMDQGFDTRLKTDPLRLGERHLLVETSYINPPAGLYQILENVWKAGFSPLIAHPERYMYMDLSDYQELKSNGYEFQLNLLSLSGYYGSRPRLVSEDLLNREMYDFVGSDLHHLHHYRGMLEHMKLTTKQLDALELLLENNARV